MKSSIPSKFIEDNVHLINIGATPLINEQTTRLFKMNTAIQMMQTAASYPLIHTRMSHNAEIEFSTPNCIASVLIKQNASS